MSFYRKLSYELNEVWHSSLRPLFALCQQKQWFFRARKKEAQILVKKKIRDITKILGINILILPFV